MERNPVNMNGMIRAALACLFTGILVTACGGDGGAPAPIVTPPAPQISTDASLAELDASAISLDQVFQGSVYDYSGTAPYLGRMTTVTATVNDPNASLQINGATGVSGEPSEPIELDFGSNLITVTVTAEDTVTSETYSIDVDRLAANALAHQAYIKAPNTGAGDRFGDAVALSGDLLAVAATEEDSTASGINGDWSDDSAANTGAVYILNRDETNTWVQESNLKASNADIFDEFGVSVALSGNTLAVGAFREDSATTGINGDQTDNSAIDAGAVYIFTRDATGLWSQQAFIKASNTDATDEFGVSVALSGDTLAVAAHMEDGSATGINGDETNNGSPNSGAVYVFTRDEAGSWSQQAYLKASNTGAGDQFGTSIALSGNSLAVGAAKESSKSTGIDGNQTNNSWSAAGAVYMFTRDDLGVWSQQAYLKASNTNSGDEFGAAVALSANTLVVGAPREDSAARGVDGFEADNKALNAGSAYVFVRDPAGAWSQQSYIKASNTDSQDQFGHSMTLDGNFLAISAYDDSSGTGTDGNDANNSAQSAGAVYLYERDGIGNWIQRAYLKASNTEPGDSFGGSVGLDGYSLVVGAQLEDSSATGVAGDATSNDAVDSGAVYIIH
ncbi:MAG: cadherin-like beta sandwich domain-containing protein [Gammaproteobacteria bacterium]|nr:cadherin-like beta sandwich domain-containing protein [Gammaproteobacteria bacterium]